MENWLRDNLSKCLECVITDKMMSTILAIKDDAEFDNYFSNLLNKDDKDHEMFLLNCRRMLLSDKIRNASNDKSTKQIKSMIATNSTKNSKNIKQKNISAISETILLKGRRMCECQAQEHKLITNCLDCGRIICEQEGNGPCLFCTKVLHAQEEDKAQKGKSQAAALTANDQSNAGNNKSLKNAVAQRDRLIEYERNSEKRTTVIDDELDYFQENSVWLTDTERDKFQRLKQETHAMKHGSRLTRKVKIDFAGREIVDEDYEQKILDDISTAQNTKQKNAAQLPLAADLSVTHHPVYRSSKQQHTSKIADDGLERHYNRVQDKELLQMQDMRQCLSLHQPWASLLVEGIKKHEGRVWYSEHRGRLWIASSVKEPNQEDITELENYYRTYYNDADIKFPEHYPAGYLLGCVNVDNCLPQEQYRELYPNGESTSPYVFICTNPEKLPVRLPIRGEHKIYELPLKTHNTACKILLRAHNIGGQ